MRGGLVIRGRLDVIITEWALQSYLTLVGTHVFDKAEYRSTIRPDVELLKAQYPHHAKFKNQKFWSPVFAHCFKMKWHQIGSGLVQLRLPVAILQQSAFLCTAYVKLTDNQEKRELAKLKTHVNWISTGNYIRRGLL